MSTLPPASSRLRARAIVTGVLGSIALCYIVPAGELIAVNIQIGMMQLAPALVGLLFAVVFCNQILGRIAPKAKLTPTELVTSYLIMMPATFISSRGLMEKWLPLLVGVNYQGPTNGWEKTFWKHIHPWLVPWDTSSKSIDHVVTWYYDGLPLGKMLPWDAWARPLICWGVLILAVYFAYLCITVILRRQWVENEKLPFPLVQLPLELMLQPGTFFRSPMMWIGFCLAFFLFGMNGFAQWFPNVPSIKLAYSINEMLTTKPWNEVSYFPIYISPAAIGFFYLMPLDLLFSFWFFFLVGKGQEVIAASLNANEGALHAAAGIHLANQCAGAFIVLAMVTLYSARHHLRFVYARAMNRLPADAGESREMMSYKVAFWGFVGSFVVIMCWCVFFGMSLWVAFLQFGIFLFVQALIISRTTAEGGMLISEGAFTPSDVFLLGNRGMVNAKSLTMLSFLDGMFTRDTRGLWLTGMLDGQKIAEHAKINARRMLWIVVGGTLLAIVAALFIQMTLTYHRGANSLYYYLVGQANTQFFRENGGILTGMAPDPNKMPVNAFWITVGGIVCALLSYLRLTVPGFPLHPLGYCMTATWGVVVFWASMFIAWAIKAPLVHYGGMKAFRTMRPLFLGLVFGEFLSACLWSMVSWFLHAPTPKFPWP
ncbi:MAG: DUF6785 family protein [Armatimonadota bacterium]